MLSTSSARSSGGSSASSRHRSPSGPAAYEEELSAVRAFVAMLEKVPNARESGSALAGAYAGQRALHGWPAVPPNVLGMLFKVAVKEVGGRHRKSGVQV